MSVDQKILLRVQKLFNLAQNNENDNEAQNALLQAQRLMAENGIEQSEVDKISPIERLKEVIKENITKGESRIPWHKKRLAMVISENFRCKTYYSQGRNGGLIFLGLKEDVELAKMVYEFAVESIELGAERFIKKYKSNYYVTKTVGIKNDYLTGWVDGLSAQYKEQVSREGWGLILVKDALVVQAIENLGLKKGQRSSHNISGNNKARETGFREGKEFSGQQTGRISS